MPSDLSAIVRDWACISWSMLGVKRGYLNLVVLVALVLLALVFEIVLRVRKEVEFYEFTRTGVGVKSPAFTLKRLDLVDYPG